MALRDVILGYAKGAKGDTGDPGPKGETGDIGPKGDPGNIADAEITDTHGIAVAAGQKTTAQAIFDAITNKIANVLVSNETLTQKLADYMLKSLMSNVQLNSTENVPTSALVYAMQQALDQLNSSLSNEIPFITNIPSESLSDTYNPMSIAEDMINENKLRIKYVQVNNNKGYENYAPVNYSVYEIRQAYDTVTINAIHYISGIIYANGKSSEGAWSGWKKCDMTSV